MENNWRIWNSDSDVEVRTYKRVTGELPEMESAKQLVNLVRNVYIPGMKILDIGCAAGHYYKSLLRLDEEIEYLGIDATVPYIEYANNYFKYQKARFLVGDIFDLSDELHGFDIVFCCNLILHLPDFRVPIKNLLRIAQKYCFIRTLISDRTHLSKFLYTDDFDENNNPTNFVYQNTYSIDLLKRFIGSVGDYHIELIDDEFDAENVNKEYVSFQKEQSAVTRVVDNYQIAGSKVFEWKWLKIFPK
ncbi:MAG: class I SAM-dependent methyltransferase [Planctomycetota bacterium]